MTNQEETSISIAPSPRLVTQRLSPASVLLKSEPTGIMLVVESEHDELVLSLLFPNSYLRMLTQNQIAHFPEMMQSSGMSWSQTTDGMILRLPVPLSPQWTRWIKNAR